MPECNERVSVSHIARDIARDQSRPGYNVLSVAALARRIDDRWPESPLNTLLKDALIVIFSCKLLCKFKVVLNA